MLRQIVRTAALLVLVVSLVGPALAADRGTVAEAQALLDKSIAFYKQAGTQKAFPQFTDPKGGFVDRDLYVFVFGPDKKVVAHGGDPKLVGTDATTLKDVDGKAFGLELLAAPAAGKWIDYKWQDPITQRVEPKSSFAKNVDGYIFGVGIYKP